MYKCLIYYNSLKSSKPDKILDFDTWAQFTNFLSDRSKVQVEHKKDNIHLSPAYTENKRKKSDILYVSKWIALDIDKTDLNLRQLILKFKSLNYKFICYNSPSCRIQNIRVRIILPLNRIIKPDEYDNFWVNLKTLTWNLVDVQSRDITRTNGAPGTFKNSYNFFIYSDSGEFVNVDEIKSLYRYNQESFSVSRLRDKYAENRSRKISFKDKKSLHEWTSYKDCVYVNKKLVTSYHNICYNDNSGRYTLFYSIMVSIATSAFRLGNDYFDKHDLERLMREIDINDIYKDRPILTEAENAINYALKHT